MAQDAATLRTEGEALVYGSGDTARDVAAGLARLEQAVAAGDPEAKATLGRILLEGTQVPADPDRAVPLLQEAAEAGEDQAARTLGMALLWGLNLPADPDRARVMLMQAARDGDTESQRVLGEQLVNGWSLPAEPRIGRALLEQAAARNDDKALVALGTHLLNGRGVEADPDRALALFERAAAIGNGAGLQRYGEWLMWGRRDPKGAETYLTRAGELGQGSAWVSLAEGAMYGYLPGERRRFEGFAERARAAGQDRIEVLEAERQMWGISMRANGPRTIARLEKAADEGNAEAADYLIRLARDGNQMNVRRRPAQAQAYLDRYAAILSPARVEQLRYTLRAAATRSTRGFAGLAEELGPTGWLGSARFARDLFEANPNFAVYLLQTRMKRDGRYGGRVDGYARRGTLRALNRECRALGDPDRCSDGVMRASVIADLLSR